MYVVLTLAELELYAGWFSGWNGECHTGIDDALGYDFRDFDSTIHKKVPREVFDACEITLSEWQARKFGILAPRGEYWIKNASQSGYFDGNIPEAKMPETRLTGYPSELLESTDGSPDELQTQTGSPEEDYPLPF